MTMMMMVMMMMMMMMTMMIADQAARGISHFADFMKDCCSPPVLEAPLADEVFLEQKQEQRRCQEC